METAVDLIAVNIMDKEGSAAGGRTFLSLKGAQSRGFSKFSMNFSMNLRKGVLILGTTGIRSSSLLMNCFSSC